jgi:hypothetical protein
MALDFSNRTGLRDDGYSNTRHSSILGFRARVLRAFGAKNASESLGALVAYEPWRRVG